MSQGKTFLCTSTYTYTNESNWVYDRKTLDEKEIVQTKVNTRGKREWMRRKRGRERNSMWGRTNRKAMKKKLIAKLSAHLFSFSNVIYNKCLKFIASNFSQPNWDGLMCVRVVLCARSLACLFVHFMFIISFFFCCAHVHPNFVPVSNFILCIYWSRSRFIVLVYKTNTINNKKLSNSV